MILYPPYRIYRYLRDYQREHGYPPTQQEIRQTTGFGKQTVARSLHALVKRGWVVHRRYSPRGTYIPTEPNQFNGGA